MNRDWEKVAEERFKSETAEARATASSHFAFSLVLGILIVAVIVVVDAARWFFFDRVPVKDDAWVLILLVVFPTFEKFYSPIEAGRTMQAKRAIRIEAKLDYLLDRHSLE